MTTDDTPIQHAVHETRLRPGGLMRCCTHTLGEWVDGQPADARVAEGTVVPCAHCSSSMILDGGAWRWNRDAS